ncbi:MAG: class I SAM-dependent methyltransferase family protein [Nitrososphaerota archaeon]|nr:class I SAM-dependent methyltransferase family protein [Nitrososphaerota archaeon]MDG6941922.1 class I SAM-dependent methyltransferase family protein [Nitrososphaerota archaeon]MDG6946905.1 class I SAM-dependent methyltransferase family protein [Nitrososphaerota archaeon]
MPRLIRAALEKAGVEGAGRVSSGVDVVGDIAIVRLAGFTPREKAKVADAILEEMRNVKVVMEQEGGIEGEFRLRKLVRLAGEARTTTVHRENGCSFMVDVEKAYFSPRLSTERLRIARLVGRDERVLNMFAGVGPFSVLIAKVSGARVTSCEMNEVAADLHEANDRLNKVDGLVTVVRGDAASLPGSLRERFDRVLMPHPSEADKYLRGAIEMTKGTGTIHYYRHVLGEDEGEAKGALRRELRRLLPAGARYKSRRVREVGPRWVEMEADIRLAAREGKDRRARKGATPT